MSLNYNFTWARLVSDILSPPMVWGAFAFPIALRDAETQEQAILWAAVYIVLVCLLPIIYIAVMVKRGDITDIHMRVRKQRIRPFLVSIACTGFAWFVLRLMGAPAVVPLFALFSFVLLTVMTLISLVWQISIHAISITGVTVATAALYGLIPALLTIPLIILVGAARLKLKRHTPAQVVAGMFVGLIVPVILFSVVTLP